MPRTTARARELAHWLQTQPAIAQVLHPALKVPRP